MKTFIKYMVGFVVLYLSAAGLFYVSLSLVLDNIEGTITVTNNITDTVEKKEGD